MFNNEEDTMGSRIRRIAVIGNYLPRKCGIATFTTDIAEALAKALPDTDVIAVPMNDREEGYAYPPRVRFEIAEREVGAYRRAADFLNVNNVDAVYLQHEFGIFGGRAGSHILTLLQELRMPVITTLHTVLREPAADQCKVMAGLDRFSDRLVVMSERAVEYLVEIYGVARDKIDFIHHGIPDVSFVDPTFYKDQFGVEGKRVLLTFGLLSPNKGVEFAIEALPAILEKYPDVVYIVLGATHPHLLRNEGESYRLGLQRLAKARGVEANVLFYNRFVSLEELCEFIGAADVYITPYLIEEQITSGTLAYSIGAGKAVVSTPYWYAEELLAEERGRLVPFKDSQAIARQVLSLLDMETARHAMRKRAYMYGRDMIWPKVAARYVKSFENATKERARHPHVAFMAKTLDKRSGDLLPKVKLGHLHRMTDSTGLIQHAKFSIPNYAEGYATDDNARGLVLTVLLEESGEAKVEEARELAARYMAFLQYAFNPEAKRFRTFMSFERRWLDEVGSEDAHGRAMWGLGVVAGRSKDGSVREMAGRLFDDALPAVEFFESPRAWAYALLGIQAYLRRFYGHRAAQDMREKLAQRLLNLVEANCSGDWPWFEDILAYDNAKLPHALMSCGQWLGRDDMIEAALRSLDWLVGIQRVDSDHLVPIGSDGFYRRGGERARFDQQPIEVHATVSACLQAFRLTGEKRWKREAQRAFEWFLGANDLGVQMFDGATGGGYDGLRPGGYNQNQGAESTLMYLLALVEMSMSQHVIAPTDPNDVDKSGEPEGEPAAQGEVALKS